jgi:hypothetical protein
MAKLIASYSYDFWFHERAAPLSAPKNTEENYWGQYHIIPCSIHPKET